MCGNKISFMKIVNKSKPLLSVLLRIYAYSVFTFRCAVTSGSLFLLRRRKTEKEIGAQKRMRDTDTYTDTPHRELHTVTSKESELKFEKEF